MGTIQPRDPTHDHQAPSNLRTQARSHRRRLGYALLVGMAIMLVEVVGGLWANSLVLLADAAHYATDLLALLLAWLAVGWATRGATRLKSFGYHRAEVVAAFVQAMALWGVSVFLVLEAVRRLRSPPEVEGPVLLLVGAFTLLANGALALYLRRAPGQSLNMHAAYLHILSDVLGSAAALVAGALVLWKGWHIADPALTLFVTLLIVIFTWRLTNQTLHILLEGTPVHIDPQAVTQAMMSVPEVRDVHDLHVWSLTRGVESVSAHVVLSRPPTDDRVTHEIEERMEREFNIQHVTVQVESPDCPCRSQRHAPAT